MKGHFEQGYKLMISCGCRLVIAKNSPYECRYDNLSLPNQLKKNFDHTDFIGGAERILMISAGMPLGQEGNGGGGGGGGGGASQDV